MVDASQRHKRAFEAEINKLLAAHLPPGTSDQEYGWALNALRVRLTLERTLERWGR